MIRMTAHAKMHEEYGEIGLWPAGRYWADPCTSGLTLAHDILEHFPKDDGSIEGELMALGACMYVRDGDSYFTMRGGRAGYAENIGSDGYTLCGYMEAEGRTLLRSCPGDRPLRDEDAECMLAMAAESMRRSARVNGHDHLAWLDGPNALDWLRRGYRKAAKRYRGISPFWVMCCFQELEKRLDQVIKRLEGYESFAISVNVRRQLIHIKELHDDGY